MNGKLAVAAAIGLILGMLAGLSLGGAFAKDTGVPSVATASPALLPDQSASAVDPLPTPARTLRDIMAEADVPPVPRGNGEITGTVTTRDGKPLAGVTVTATTSYPERRYYAELAAEERVRQEIRYARWLDDAAHSVTTDAQGRYGIAGLAEDVEYNVSASAEGWRIERKDPKQRGVRPPGEYHLIAQAEIVLTVHVEMEDGSAPRRASVQYRATALTREQSGLAWEGPATLRLTPGQWVLYAVSDDYNWSRDSLQHRSETLELTIVEGEAADPVTLVLKPTPSIGGNIAVPRGFDRLPVDVYVQADPPGGPPPGSGRDISGKTQARVWSDGDQVFWQCSNLRSGPYRILLLAEDAVLDWADVVLSGSRAECNLEVPAPSLDDYIVIRVFSPGGELLRDVELGMTAYSKGGSYGYGPEQTIDEEGRIWLRRNRRGEDVAYEWFQIHISHSKHGEKTVRYEAVSREVLDVHLETPAFLVLTVPGWEELRGKSALKWRLWQADMDRRGSRAMADDARQNTSPIRIGPVGPGDYELRLELHLDSFRNVTLVERPVALVSGDNYLTESAPQLHSLAILAPEGESLPRLEVVANSGKYQLDLSRDSRDGSRYDISHIPAGTYRLISSKGEMSVTISGPSEVVFVPRAYDCLVLTVLPEGGPLEGLGLKDGDKLIEVDARNVAGDDSAYMLVQGALIKESTTWIVLRDGVRTAVTFDGRELFKMISDRTSEAGVHFGLDRGYRE